MPDPKKVVCHAGGDWHAAEGVRSKIYFPEN